MSLFLPGDYEHDQKLRVWSVFTSCANTPNFFFATLDVPKIATKKRGFDLETECEQKWSRYRHRSTLTKHLPLYCALVGSRCQVLNSGSRWLPRVSIEKAETREVERTVGTGFFIETEALVMWARQQAPITTRSRTCWVEWFPLDWSDDWQR